MSGIPFLEDICRVHRISRISQIRNKLADTSHTTSFPRPRDGGGLTGGEGNEGSSGAPGSSFNTSLCGSADGRVTNFFDSGS